MALYGPAASLNLFWVFSGSYYPTTSRPTQPSSSFSRVCWLSSRSWRSAACSPARALSSPANWLSPINLFHTGAPTCVILYLRGLPKLVRCLLSITLAASAGEYVVLSNGFRIHADSHSTDGTVVQLQTSQGVIQIQASTVAAFEQED